MIDFDLMGVARKIKIPSYIFFAVMLVVESLIRFKIFDQTGTVGFKWIPFNVFVLSIMAATLNFAGYLTEKGKDSCLSKLASATFFLYAAHYVLLPFFQKTLYLAFSPMSMTANIIFYWVFLGGYILLLTGVFFFLRRIIPKTLAFLTGGRI